MGDQGTGDRARHQAGFLGISVTCWPRLKTEMPVGGEETPQRWEATKHRPPCPGAWGVGGSAGPAGTLPSRADPPAAQGQRLRTGREGESQAPLRARTSEPEPGGGSGASTPLGGPDKLPSEQLASRGLGAALSLALMCPQRGTPWPDSSPAGWRKRTQFGNHSGFSGAAASPLRPALSSPRAAHLPASPGSPAIDRGGEHASREAGVPSDFDAPFQGLL